MNPSTINVDLNHDDKTPNRLPADKTPPPFNYTTAIRATDGRCVFVSCCGLIVAFVTQ
jgi:hypothetical protein